MPAPKRRPSFRNAPRRGSKPKRAPRAAGAPAEAPAGGERLQKVMASAGVGSRRHCEELIASGRVEVDRQVVREQGTRVDLARQEIRVDGTPLAKTKRVYFLVNKPLGVVSTNFDPSGRPRVIDLFPNIRERLFTVGRLDLSSEGLMLVTNDGQLANELAHPRYGVEKTYHVLVAGQATPEALAPLRQGVRLAEAVARVESVRIKSTLKQSTLLEIVLAEGRNREIRRLLAKVGHKVLRLKRVALGGVRLKDLAPGEFRRLRSDELRLLRQRAKPDAQRPATSRATEMPDRQTYRKPKEPRPSRPDQAASRPGGASAGSRKPHSRPTKKGGSKATSNRPADRRGRPKGRRSEGGSSQGGRP
ncbi:MAG TPA: pseudouridine synthase [Pirellulales bacterium]|nr:pseudouridine synthase [Pirellulales bacterium]